MSSNPTRLPKMMLGFVVRRCTVALGHRPSPAEFAAWANAETDGEQGPRLFGRPISEEEARLILKHQARLVTARSANELERYVEAEEMPAPRPNVVPLERARDARRLQSRR